MVSTLIINQHIRMLSEGSCDTETWSYDAENTALTKFQIVIIFHDISLFYCIFDQINAALMSRITFFFNV